MISMEHIIAAAKDQGRVIGHDGCSSPLDVADVDASPLPCTCDGSGYKPVLLDGTVIATVPCGGDRHG